MPNTWQPSPLAQGIINFGNYLQNPGQIFPGALPTNYKATEAAAIAKANAYSSGAGWQKLLGLPAGYQPGASAAPSRGQAPVAPTRGQAPAAGAGSAGVNPNTIVQSSDDTYNQLLSQYGAEGVSKLANMSALPTNFSPTAGAKPASLSQYYAAQTMQGNAGLGEIVNKMGYSGDMAKWAKANPALAQRAYANKFGTAPGGGEGMYNPQMQAHGDVPSMAELWQGIGGGAPTTGPSQDAIKAAMARGINQPGSGGFYAPSGSPNPTAGFDQSANPAAASLQQQMDTAKQANIGTEATTTLQKTNDFLRGLNLGNLNPGSYNFPGTSSYSGAFSQPIQTGNYQ